MLFSVKQYLKYLFQILLKNNSSPFLEEFISNVLNNKTDVTYANEIDELKEYYKSLNQGISKEDYGAGSRRNDKNTTLSIATLLKQVSISTKNGVLLHHLAKYYGSRTCIELGTSLGIATAYLSNKNNNIVSIEGNSALSLLSKTSLKKVGINNIEIINAKFDEVLDNLLKEKSGFDLLFVDGNHTEKATLAYFEIAIKHLSSTSIIVFDDINWSLGMNNAWNKIIKHPDVKISIDLFRQGIVFFDREIKNKEHYTLWH